MQIQISVIRVTIKKYYFFLFCFVLLENTFFFLQINESLFDIVIEKR